VSITDKVCWVLSNGRAGTENQCVGLAAAIGLPTQIKQVRCAPPWRWLPPRAWPNALGSLGPDSSPLAPPWPDLLIACGRSTEAVAVAIRRASRKAHRNGEGPATFVVYLQRPSHGLGQFDLLAPPQHDQVTGSNVISTVGALHRVTPEQLDIDAAKFAPLVAHLRRPLITVLVGGTGNAYQMTVETAQNLGRQLATMAAKHSASLAVTVSRRTGDANAAALRAALIDTPTVFWPPADRDREGDNPYFGFLGLADAIVVTADSISMASEACASGKPVYIADLPGGSAKFRRFHDGLRAAGLIRTFAGVIEQWSTTRLDDTARVAAAVRDQLNLV
jgi:uncharacterized protein